MVQMEDVDTLNRSLEDQSPQDILAWAVSSLPGLVQTTAFGPSGLVIMDMLSKQAKDDFPVPVVFIDTLYHFDETIALSQKASAHYRVPLHVYKPHLCDDLLAFESKHGATLWERKPDAYDYIVKVEPAQRAYSDLNVQAVITGRRRSQRGDRAHIPVIEMTSRSQGDSEFPLLKINPLASWSYEQVWAYIRDNQVPYNPLHDSGYKSIGDRHSTSIPAANGDERAGRWAGKAKSECGLHKDVIFFPILWA